VDISKCAEVNALRVGVTTGACGILTRNRNVYPRYYNQEEGERDQRPITSNIPGQSGCDVEQAAYQPKTYSLT